MWTVEEFLSLVETDPPTFGDALGEHSQEIAALIAADERVRGFIVYLGLDPVTHERIEWTLHLLTDITLVRFNVNARDGSSGSHRYTVGSFAEGSGRSLGAERDPLESDKLHRLRDTEWRLTLKDGSYTRYDGSEWFAMWEGSVTDLAVRGASEFLVGLPHLA